MGRIGMSQKELRRVEVLSRVKSKELKGVDAASLLRVSYRQGKRLWKRYREEGACGLQRRSAGRSSNRAHGKKFRQQVLRRVRDKYSGAVGQRFGPTLAEFSNSLGTNGIMVAIKAHLEYQACDSKICF